MRAKIRPNGSRRGVVLLGVLLALFTIALIGSTLASFFLSVNTDAEVELARAQALYLAEAGLAQTLHQIREAGMMGGQVEPETAPVPLGEGQYQVAHDQTTGMITSTGVVRGMRRTVQMRYVPF